MDAMRDPYSGEAFHAPLQDAPLRAIRINSALQSVKYFDPPGNFP
jgi:hypothetical protein